MTDPGRSTWSDRSNSFSGQSARSFRRLPTALGTEVAKRIDVFAAAIHHGMSAEEASDLDLSYTPPLSSSWDPVQMATQAWTVQTKMPGRL